jgi:hypothetical protein
MFRKLMRHARGNAVAYVALFVALGGSAVAATLKANSVGTKQLKNRAVTGQKVAKNTPPPSTSSTGRSRWMSTARRRL